MPFGVAECVAVRDRDLYFESPLAHERPYQVANLGAAREKVRVAYCLPDLPLISAAFLPALAS